MIVAFSGGVDSTLVLKLALETLGDKNVLAVTGVSPSIPPRERDAAEALAKTIGARFMVLNTYEMENENYRLNPKNRCFFCKEELFTKLRELAKERNYKTVLDGTNADDAKDFRPGLRAARQLSVRSPLLEAGLGKEDIRAISRHFNLPNWDKPAMPCLSSRVPYGQPITLERLNRIDRAEEALRHHGFREVRVRDHFPSARIEVALEELPRLMEEPLRDQIFREIEEAGYASITVDPAGFRSGSLNRLP